MEDFLHFIGCDGAVFIDAQVVDDDGGGIDVGAIKAAAHGKLDAALVTYRAFHQLVGLIAVYIENLRAVFIGDDHMVPALQCVVGEGFQEMYFCYFVYFKVFNMWWRSGSSGDVPF